MTPLRAGITALLPENTYIRVDRTGRALFAVAADADAIAVLTASGWQCEAAGRIALAAPGPAQLHALRGAAPHHPHTEIFRDRPDDVSLLPLLCALLRAHEMPPTPAAKNKLDKQLRQAMAVALRTGAGGGLEACHYLFATLPTT